MLSSFLRHHVLANLTFLMVMVMGAAAFQMLPREKDPEINFNWIQITTPFPGASAVDVEKLVTEPLEEAIAKVSDIKFISSTSREGLSTILVRFEDIDPEIFDKRVNDLRREVQNVENSELPDITESPFVFEVTSANAFPTATLVLQGLSDDELLHRTARTLEKALERLKGVERVDALGLSEPELHVLFDPARLATAGVNPTDVADTVRAHFRDVSAGTVQVGDRQWLVRLVGTNEDPSYLAQLPVMAAHGELPLGTVARVQGARGKPTELVSFEGRPAVMLSVFKKGGANTLELLGRLRQTIEARNPGLASLGLTLKLIDDQTASTRQALSVMQTNALLGLVLVLFVTWLFLGSRIALFTSIGIPFTLAGTFWLLSVLDISLNNSVLLGVVISLGMLVDDAVVVVEGIYYRLQRGFGAVEAAVESLKEVAAPVTASVATTVAAFLPLMLMPGLLGDFMRVIPLVVSLALAISLVEAYWMLPAHVIAARVNFARPSRVHLFRERFTHAIRLNYGRSLVRVMRRPVLALTLVGGLFALSIGAFGAGLVRVDFFALEHYRLFYVNLEMPVGSHLDGTLERVGAVEERVRRHLLPGEARGIVSYAGVAFTETEPRFGDQHGQLMVSLTQQQEGMRDVSAIVDSMRRDVLSVAGPVKISFFEVTDGPPVTKPINVKVRGDDIATIRPAVEALREAMAGVPAIHDITDDDTEGGPELALRLDTDAARRAGLDPAVIARLLRLLADGEIASSFQFRGEKVDVRVQAEPRPLQDVDALLVTRVALPGGGEMALRDLVIAKAQSGEGNIRHYNLRRAVTLMADLDKGAMDTVTANRLIEEAWGEIGAGFPGIDLDFSGELDDIQESLNAIFVLFLFGVGVIYLILGTQFRSYFQPLMILSTIPMAFTGVVAGLLITGHPLSLYTLYGVVALAGIAVNAAIVLISAANDRLASGMSVYHAAIYAARRRVIPVLITSLTTIAGLFSLATGLGGRSPMWGPVATAIVWGLAFSTVLTLYVVPLLYRLFMARGGRRAVAVEPSLEVVSASS